jgi:hypothetical protein
MNRAQRRRAYAQARKRRSYIDRVLAAHRDHPFPVGLTEGVVFHSDRCTFHTNGACTCTPEISIHGPNGDLLVVASSGQQRRYAHHDDRTVRRSRRPEVQQGRRAARRGTRHHGRPRLVACAIASGVQATALGHSDYVATNASPQGNTAMTRQQVAHLFARLADADVDGDHHHHVAIYLNSCGIRFEGVASYAAPIGLITIDVVNGTRAHIRAEQISTILELKPRDGGQ